MSLRALLPPETTLSPPDETVVLDLASDQSDQVFDVLSSSTARRILTSLYERPRPASELARDLDLTIQNVNYHVNNLRDADLIEVGDTWYSDKGNEMKVYAPSAKAVMVVSDRSTTDRIRDAIARALGIVVLLGASAMLFRFAALQLLEDGGVDGPAAMMDSPEEDIAMDSAEPIPTEEPSLLVELLADPAVVFFLGGLAVLLIVAGIVVIRRYRPLRTVSQWTRTRVFDRPAENPSD